MFEFSSKKSGDFNCHLEFSGNSRMTLMFPGDTVKSIHVPHFTRELLNESLLSSTGNQVGNLAAILPWPSSVRCCCCWWCCRPWVLPPKLFGPNLPGSLGHWATWTAEGEAYRCQGDPGTSIYWRIWHAGWKMLSNFQGEEWEMDSCNMITWDRQANISCFWHHGNGVAARPHRPKAKEGRDGRVMVRVGSKQEFKGFGRMEGKLEDRDCTFVNWCFHRFPDLRITYRWNYHNWLLFFLIPLLSETLALFLSSKPNASSSAEKWISGGC